MIEISELRVEKSGRTICSVPSFSVATGERVAVLGDNGSGKSTLLRVLAALEKDCVGQCDLNCAVNDRVLVQQNPFLFRGTVLSNVVYGLAARGITGAAGKERAMQFVRQMGLSDIANQSTQHLSGGETRRVALARGLVLRPTLLLLDEPFAEMDPQGKEAIRVALENLSDEVTVIITSPTDLPEGIATRRFQISGVK